jgi:hypothetical protein
MTDFDPRRASPGDTFTVTGPEGEVVDFAADAEGIVRPETAEQAALLDQHGLPRARTVMAAESAEEPEQTTVGKEKAKAKAAPDEEKG